MSFAQSLAKAMGPTPYSAAYVKEIKWRRQRIGGEGLGIDRLLVYAGVRPEIYPPTSRDGFMKLVEQVEAGSASAVFKSRALLYIFIDFSELADKKCAQSTDQTVAEYFASQLWMSAPEQSLIKSIWLLDHNRASEAFEFLGEPWEVHGAASLHEYIVAALTEEQPSRVASYLAARGDPSSFVDQLAKSLVVRGKFAEVLEIAREHENAQYLVEMTRSAVESKEYALELVQLAYTPDEWSCVQEELERIAATASPPPTNTRNATSKLATDIILVRALHRGDINTLKELKGISEVGDLLIAK